MKTALQEHIEWLEDTLSIAKEHAPILENCLKLCISDAKLRLEKEKKQIELAYRTGWINYLPNTNPEEYYNETYKIFFPQTVA